MASFVIYMFTVCHKTSLEMKWKTNLARSWSRLWWSKVRTSSLRLKGVELPVVRKYFDMDVSSVTVNLSAWWPIRGHSGSPHGKHFPCEDQHSTVTERKKTRGARCTTVGGVLPQACWYELMLVSSRLPFIVAMCPDQGQSVITTNSCRHKSCPWKTGGKPAYITPPLLSSLARNASQPYRCHEATAGSLKLTLGRRSWAQPPAFRKLCCHPPRYFTNICNHQDGASGANVSKWTRLILSATSTAPLLPSTLLLFYSDPEPRQPTLTWLREQQRIQNNCWYMQRSVVWAGQRPEPNRKVVLTVFSTYRLTFRKGCKTS